MSTFRFQEVFFSELKQILSQPRRIVITTHHRPDGDAMGSSLGLYNYLIQNNHSVQVITPNDYPDFLQWLPGNGMVLNYEMNRVKADEVIASVELIFCLDFNHLERIEEMEKSIRHAPAMRVLIDHHLDPEQSFRFVFSYTDACSTSELIFQFIEAMGDKHLVSKSVAECIYTGIMTDTQSFRLPTVTPLVHQVVSALMEAGAENFKIYENVYESATEDRLRLLGYCLNEKLKVLQEFRTAYIALSQAEMDHYRFQPGDTEGVVNYALSIKGIKMAAFFSERDSMVKISFRSKSDFSVKDLAAAHFDGGGHRNASGGKSKKSLAETVEKFLGLLPAYKPELQK